MFNLAAISPLTTHLKERKNGKLGAIIRRFPITLNSSTSAAKENTAVIGKLTQIVVDIANVNIMIIK